MTQSYLGNILEKGGHEVVTGAVKANVKLTKGLAVYDDGTNGFAVVPTSGQPPASQVRFVENEADNTGGAKGDKLVETWKGGVVMVVLCHGNVPIGSKLRCSETTAGSLDALADPADASLNATFNHTEAEAALDAERDVVKYYVADYLGHPDEFRTGKAPTAATDGQEIVIRIK